MLGNVWEWTASTYASYPGAATPGYPGGAPTYGQGPDHYGQPYGQSHGQGPAADPYGPQPGYGQNPEYGQPGYGQDPYAPGQGPGYEPREPRDPRAPRPGPASQHDPRRVDWLDD